MIRIALPSLLLLSLAACGGEPSGTSTTKLDAVEVEPGTISDTMIILDDASSDGTAVDNSTPGDSSAKAAEKEDDGAVDEGAADSSDANTIDAASAPAAAKKSE